MSIQPRTDDPGGPLGLRVVDGKLQAQAGYEDSTRRGRRGGRVRPLPSAEINALVILFFTDTVRAGELCGLRAGNLKRDGVGVADPEADRQPVGHQHPEVRQEQPPVPLPFWLSSCGWSTTSRSTRAPTKCDVPLFSGRPGGCTATARQRSRQMTRASAAVTKNRGASARPSLGCPRSRGRGADRGAKC